MRYPTCLSISGQKQQLNFSNQYNRDNAGKKQGEITQQMISPCNQPYAVPILPPQTPPAAAPAQRDLQVLCKPSML